MKRFKARHDSSGSGCASVVDMSPLSHLRRYFSQDVPSFDAGPQGSATATSANTSASTSDSAFVSDTATTVIGTELNTFAAIASAATDAISADDVVMVVMEN